MATVKYCFISSDVYFVCMQHALSTEIEEVMGLLIGYNDEKQGHCHATHTVLLKRLDKRKDRVEISPELLATAITYCDELNADRVKSLGKAEAEALPHLRVVGWYHSHPHITVFPSEVDLRTQDVYQVGVDPMWIGLIFGVYNAEENTGLNKFQYIAFQSVHKDHSGRLVQALIPVVVEPSLSENHLPPKECLKNLEKLLENLFTEEYEAYAKKKSEILDRGVSVDPLTFLQNVSTLSKNISKIIRHLAAPMSAVLHDSLLRSFRTVKQHNNNGNL